MKDKSKVTEKVFSAWKRRTKLCAINKTSICYSFHFVLFLLFDLHICTSLDISDKLPLELEICLEFEDLLAGKVKYI